VMPLLTEAAVTGQPVWSASRQRGRGGMVRRSQRRGAFGDLHGPQRTRGARDQFEWWLCS